VKADPKGVPQPLSVRGYGVPRPAEYCRVFDFLSFELVHALLLVDQHN
jgi:hypothetical protein